MSALTAMALLLQMPEIGSPYQASSLKVMITSKVMADVRKGPQLAGPMPESVPAGTSDCTQEVG